MVRYVLASDVRKGYVNPADRTTAVELPYHSETNYEWAIFCNVLDANEDTVKLRVFLRDGNYKDLWFGLSLFPLVLWNKEELFDGRFNA